MGIERISEFWPSWNAVELLGKGGNGEVYKCVHEEMGVKSYSAIKVINISSRQMNTFTFDSGSIRSFCQNLIEDCVNEINVMLSLKSCPNIVAIEDFKVVETVKDEEWEIFIRMELLTCLTDYLRDRVLTQDEVIKLGVDLCTALELCHSKNIMHRDIKPANIFVNELGDFKLGDFGIARTLEMATAGFSQKGTVTYVAPEVMYSNDYTKAVDIYSLGLVLYQLANNNRLPFLPAHGDYTHTMQNDAIKNRLKGDTFPPACNADETLNSILNIACEYEPGNRFQSAGQMKKALNAHAVHSPMVQTETKKLYQGKESVAPPYIKSSGAENIYEAKTMVEAETVNQYKNNENENNKKVSRMSSLTVVVICLCVIMTVLLVSVAVFFVKSNLNSMTNENNYHSAVQNDVEENEGQMQLDDKAENDGAANNSDNANVYNYSVGYNTPDHAGIVVRSDSTYYSDKITVLSEGTPVNVLQGFADGTEYIYVSFDVDGKKDEGWVLGKYIVDKNSIVYHEDSGYDVNISYDQEKINTYITNITEVGMTPFSGTPSFDEIVQLTFLHSLINYNPDVSGIEYGDYNIKGHNYNVRIRKDYISELSFRFFGMNLNASNYTDDRISGDYLYGYADGSEKSCGVAITDSITYNETEKKYMVHFSVYRSDSFDETKYYSYSISQAQNDGNLKYSFDGYVVIQKHTYNNQETYKIIEYNLI